MDVQYRAKVDGSYVVQTLHRVFVDYTEITEEYDGEPSDRAVFENVVARVMSGEFND